MAPLLTGGLCENQLVLSYRQIEFWTFRDLQNKFQPCFFCHKNNVCSKENFQKKDFLSARNLFTIEDKDKKYAVDSAMQFSTKFLMVFQETIRQRES